jgi:hypothetical protein
MRIASDQLRDKALLALEELVQETRFGTVRRTFALRFTLAYLWAIRPVDRAPYDEFWQAMVSETMWRFESANGALSRIHQAHGVARDSRTGMALWERRYEEKK